jgi:hypothetical protein
MPLALKNDSILEILMININGEKTAADMYIQDMQFPRGLAATSSIPLSGEKTEYAIKLQQVKTAIPTAQMNNCSTALSLIRFTGIATTSVGPRMISFVLKHEYVQLNVATSSWLKLINNAPVFVTHGASCGHGLHIAAIEHAVPTNMSAPQTRISTLPVKVLSDFEKVMIGIMNMRPVALAA